MTQEVQISSIEQVVVAIPYLVGFIPQDSLVLIRLEGSKLCEALRFDHPQGPLDIPHILAVAGHHLGEDPNVSLIAAAYVDAVPESCNSDLQAMYREKLYPALKECFNLDDFVIVTGDRIVPIACSDSNHCPSEGSRIDPQERAKAREYFAQMGITDEPQTRINIAATMAPLARNNASVLALVKKVRAAVTKRAKLQSEPNPRAEFNTVMRVFTADAAITHPELATGLHALTDVRVRDAVLREIFFPTTAPVDAEASMDRITTIEDNVRACARIAPREFSASLYAISGHLYWQDQDVMRASMALRCALDADPTYSLASLMLRFLSQSGATSNLLGFLENLPLSKILGEEE